MYSIYRRKFGNLAPQKRSKSHKYLPIWRLTYTTININNTQHWSQSQISPRTNQKHVLDESAPWRLVNVKYCETSLTQTIFGQWYIMNPKLFRHKKKKLCTNNMPGEFLTYHVNTFKAKWPKWHLGSNQ